MLIEDAAFDAWVDELRRRHTQALTFPEIRKGVVALSRIYVEERNRIGSNVFAGAGKRAAFACFYTPLHYLLVHEIVTRLDAHEPPPSRIVDLGCGLLPAGAAWARASGSRSEILGVDQSAWALAEARASLGAFGLNARTLRKRIHEAPMPKRGEALVAAFAVNELSADGNARKKLLGRLVSSSRRGATVLIVEPIARRTASWWQKWSEVVTAEGGRADEWRFAVELPAFVSELDRASGLNHRELSGRSLFIRGFS
ncbi:MAG: hypothetical protein BMS9Abin37_1176 [Acidobacteriota bacterium]|nr:MAG: hypothetical protein BMS9Abin37_1176 [Acidobacteriota bacterium]